MFNRKLWIFILVLLGFILVPTVFATPPTVFDDGIWTFNFANPDEDVLSFCFTTETSGYMEGCGYQPLTANSRTVKGVYEGYVDGQYVMCEYNLSTFSASGRSNGAERGFSRFSMQHCTDGEGNDVTLHLVGQANNDGDGFWGTYEARFHFDP